MISPGIGLIALRRAVVQREFFRIADLRRQGVAHQDDMATGPLFGPERAFVYHNSWTERGYLKSTNPLVTQFGRNLSLSGDGKTVKVKSPLQDNETRNWKTDRCESNGY